MSIDLRPHTKSLYELSLWFVCDIMKVRRGLPIAAICEEVMRFVPPQNTQAKLKTVLASVADLPECIKAELLKLNQDAVRGKKCISANVVPFNTVSKTFSYEGIPI